MPACGPGWVLVPGTWMTSGTLSTILREVLVLQGIPREEVETYASHSMETTFLSWAGKSGLFHREELVGQRLPSWGPPCCSPVRPLNGHKRDQGIEKLAQAPAAQYCRIQLAQGSTVTVTVTVTL